MLHAWGVATFKHRIVVNEICSWQIPVFLVRPIDCPDEKPSENNEPEQSTNWSDVLPYLYKPWKIFSLRQDLPKRVNFAYFWARTRIVQKGIMVS